MQRSVQLLDVVALTCDRPELGLVRGQVGTFVEVLSPSAYEVEFSDDDGRTYAQAPMSERELIVLRYVPQHAA